MPLQKTLPPLPESKVPVNPAASVHPFSNPNVSPIAQLPTTPNQSIRENVSESPMVQVPGGSGTPSTSKPTGRGSNILILLVLLVLLIGIGAGGFYYLRTLQQAPTTRTTVNPTPQVQNSARIILEPSSGALDGGVEQKIQFFADLSNTPITVSGVNFKLNFGGETPNDLAFIQESQSPLPAPQANLVNQDTGKILEVSFTLSEPITLTSKKVLLGSLQFTSPASGQLNIRFDSAGSKILTQPNSIDILRPPSIISYTFQITDPQTALTEASDSAQLAQTAVTLSPTSAATATPTLSDTDSETGGTFTTITPTPTTTIQPTSLPTSTTVPTRTPSPTPTATTAPAGVGGLSSSPTVTRTPTPTSASEDTETLADTSSRSNSQPARSQSLPVSGGISLTVQSISVGVFFIVVGLWLWPKLRKSKHEQD